MIQHTVPAATVWLLAKALCTLYLSGDLGENYFPKVKKSLKHSSQISLIKTKLKLNGSGDSFSLNICTVLFLF